MEDIFGLHDWRRMDESPTLLSFYLPEWSTWRAIVTKTTEHEDWIYSTLTEYALIVRCFQLSKDPMHTLPTDVKPWRNKRLLSIRRSRLKDYIFPLLSAPHIRDQKPSFESESVAISRKFHDALGITKHEKHYDTISASIDDQERAREARIFLTRTPANPFIEPRESSFLWFSLLHEEKIRRHQDINGHYRYSPQGVKE